MLVSSLAFGMMHYNAYNWNLFQMLVTIGLTRIPFDWAWYKTDSLWTGIVGHIIFDLLAFLVGGYGGVCLNISNNYYDHSGDSL